MPEHPSRDEVVMLEIDETIPPRPEEEIAEILRAQAAPPDLSGSPQTGPAPVPDDERG